MKNRAKCKLCQSTIESLHRTDYVSCKCGQIAVYGGPDLMQCSAIDWTNFLRVDDNGHEIVVTVKGIGESFLESKDVPATRDLVSILDQMIADIDRLPKHAMTSPITQMEYQVLLMILSAHFKSLTASIGP